MTILAAALHVLYLNKDYQESALVLRSPVDVAIETSKAFNVGVRPLDGIDAAFWERVDNAYEAGSWKGASWFVVSEIGDKELTQTENPLIPAEELNKARINAPLTQNPAEPFYMLLLNQDYVEYAFALADLKQVIGKLITKTSREALAFRRGRDRDRFLSPACAGRGHSRG